MQLDADVAGLAEHLRKPLRALWISQNSRIWIDQTPDPGEWPFTPVILVSASLPNARQRRFARESYPGLDVDLKAEHPLQLCKESGLSLC